MRHLKYEWEKFLSFRYFWFLCAVFLLFNLWNLSENVKMSWPSAEAVISGLLCPAALYRFSGAAGRNERTMAGRAESEEKCPLYRQPVYGRRII